jgi:hypothetical protein
MTRATAFRSMPNARKPRVLLCPCGRAIQSKDVVLFKRVAADINGYHVLTGPWTGRLAETVTELS